MLKIYRPISVPSIDPLEGTTNPIVVTAECEGDIQDFVVKLFNQQAEFDSHSYVTKEFYAVDIAKEFDLFTPKSVIIDLNEEFIGCFDDSLKERIRNIYPRYAFGSEYMSPRYDYSTAMKNKHLKIYNTENIFAFDLLIQNVDRRVERPNLFFTNESACLIDHDLSLNFKPFHEYESATQMIYMNTGNFRVKDHLFLEHLKKKKAHVNFNEFEEYLRNLNLRKVQEHAHQLRELGFNTNDFIHIFDALNETKKAHNTFKQALISVLMNS